MPSPRIATCEREAAWQLRHRDPEGLARAVEQLAPGPVTTYLRARVALGRGDLARCLELCDEAEPGLEPSGRWHARLLETRGNTLVTLGVEDEAQRHLSAALQAYHDADDLVGVASALQNIATMRCQPSETAAQIYREALALAEQVGQRDLSAIIMTNLQEVGVDLGMTLDERETLVRRAEEIFDEEWPAMAVNARCLLTFIAVEREDLGRAAALAGTLPDPTEVLDRSVRCRVALARAQVACALGRPDGAAGVLRATLACALMSEDVPTLRRRLAESLEACGRTAEALEESYAAMDALRQVADEDASSVARALDVWHRTALVRQAEQDAKARAESLEGALADLRAANLRIREMSVRDGLTGLHNRQHLMDVGDLLARRAGLSSPAQVALVDLDDFKAVNDTFGHAAGDAVLVSFARVLRDHLPDGDLLARYGGEEFVVLRVPARRGAPVDDLAADLDRVRAVLAAHPVVGEGGRVLPPARMSVGVARLVGECLQEGLRVADRRMYAAKRAGGDRVVAHDLPQTGTAPAVPVLEEV